MQRMLDGMPPTEARAAGERTIGMKAGWRHTLKQAGVPNAQLNVWINDSVSKKCKEYKQQELDEKAEESLHITIEMNAALYAILKRPNVSVNNARRIIDLIEESAENLRGKLGDVKQLSNSDIKDIGLTIVKYMAQWDLKELGMLPLRNAVVKIFALIGEWAPYVDLVSAKELACALVQEQVLLPSTNHAKAQSIERLSSAITGWLREHKLRAQDQDVVLLDDGGQPSIGPIDCEQLIKICLARLAPAETLTPSPLPAEVTSVSKGSPPMPSTAISRVA